MKRILSVSLFSLFLLFVSGCAEEEALCAEGEIECDGTCVDAKNDPLNCGGCGLSCYAGEFCIEGACGCPGGAETCDPVSPDLFALCFQAGQMVPLSKEHELRTGPSLSGMEGPQTMAALGDDHVVLVGALDQVLRVVDRHEMKVVGSLTFGAEAGPTAPNHVIVEGDRAYVVHSATNEITAVDLSDTTKPRVVYSVSTGEGTNPSFATLAEGTLYVSLWLTDSVIPIQLGADEGEAKAPIAIEGSLEGKAYPSGMAFAAGRVFSALNNFDESFAPAGNGRLWSYDPQSEAQELIDLGEGCTNASFLASWGERVYVACTGRYGENDGAIAIYDPAKAVDLELIPTGGSPARLSTDGTTLYVADGAGTTLMVIGERMSIEHIPLCAEREWEFVADVLVLP